MSKELEVRNLRISFKTNNGTVKAVRDISFDLEKGETLCIVGESGSGKSVTAKAMLGILAGNSIVEGGEIIYRGQNLLRYTEDDFNRIRGNKITMIFQDPMSSLDPIMKIGRQLTEATVLNGKTNRKNAAKDLKSYIKNLKGKMLAAGLDGSSVNANIDTFTKMIHTGSKYEASYEMVKEYSESYLLSVEQLEIDRHSEDGKVLAELFSEMAEKIERVLKYAEQNYFAFADQAEDYKNTLSNLKSKLKSYKSGDATALCDEAVAAGNLFHEMLNRTTPNFFLMGYYVNKYGEEKLHGVAFDEMNECLRKTADEEFMLAFLVDIAKALEYSEKEVIPAKESAIVSLKKNLPVFEAEQLDASKCRGAEKEMIALVEKSINPIALYKNPDAYTFASTMKSELDAYFSGVKNNPKENARVKREEAKREQVIAKKGDAPKVVPAVLVDLDFKRDMLLHAIKNLTVSYEKEIADIEGKDFDAIAVDVVDYLKQLSYNMVHRVTKQMAYDKAIRIMQDVGIKDPRKRFNQYPFEFSGGMRQRIVIAIAIAANPDILICDEPTTALDVTIQAQILELINEVKRKRNISVIFITHDLGVVANMADKVAVMYAGQIVEYGTAEEVFYEPAHPYTWALLASMPDLDTKEKLEAIPGTPPNMIYPPVGDAFAERNQYAMAIDFEKQPPKFRISDTHWAATWLLHPDAPKVDPPKSVTDRIARMKQMEESENE